jgi:hypothetical protein
MSTRSRPGHGAPDPGLDAIASERRQLINLTYRLLGSLAEAEDAVQEAYARWYAMSAQQQDAIESPGAWLTTVASRICLDLLGSARARRERYVGEWIPEPLPEPAEWISGRPGGTAIDPADRVTLDEPVSMAFLAPPHRWRRADRAVPGRPRRPGTRQRDVPGAHGQRPARSGGPARRRHRDGVRVRRLRRPDHAHLGHTQPREAPALDDALTHVALPLAPPGAVGVIQLAGQLGQLCLGRVLDRLARSLDAVLSVRFLLGPSVRCREPGRGGPCGFGSWSWRTLT